MAKNIKRKLTPTPETPTVYGSDLETFAHRLHTALLDKGWSQSDLARRVWGEIRYDAEGNPAGPVGRDRISQYCRAKAMPAPGTLKKIAQVLGTTAEELAPNITASTIQREQPALKLEMVAGHSDKCLVKINRIMPLRLALKIAEIVEEAEHSK